MLIAYSMSNNTVNCLKLGKELPALTEPPFEGELGEKIQSSVSAEGWKLWEDDMMIKVINEYRLNLAEPKDYQVLLDQMCLFLNVKQDGETLEVGNPETAKG